MDPLKIEPPPHAAIAPGAALLAEGKCALIVLAGGLGSRLGFDGPKGCFPILPEHTLYSLLAKKIKELSAHYSRELEVAFMTSNHTDQKTREYFIQHGYFGAARFHFFIQADQETGGPNGNGDLFDAFGNSPLLKHWKERDIEFVQVIPVDNPLAPLFDSRLLGFHQMEENEVSMIVGYRKNEFEKCGVIARIAGKIGVVEYTELEPNQRNLKHYPYANFGIYVFNLSFMERMKNQSLPLHEVKKNGLYKYEKFIFDVLPFSKKTSCLFYPRDQVFAPLKNYEGEDSIETVREALGGK